VEAEQIKNILEGLLFIAERPLSISELARLLELDQGLVKKLLLELAEDYESRGLRLQYRDSEWQMVTAPQVAPYIEKYLGSGRTARLSKAALETLAVVAYHQPVTQSKIEAIRGVSCEYILRTLIHRKLIEDKGRESGPGRPILYGTTFEFLQFFGIKSLEDLPRITESQ